MSEAAAVDTHDHAEVRDQLEPSLTPGNFGKLGMWTFLAGDAMTFGAAIAAYGALRIDNPNWPSPAAFLGITTHRDHDLHPDLLERHDGRGAQLRSRPAGWRAIATSWR